MAINQFQRKHLQERIKAARDARYARVHDEIEKTKPASIRRTQEQIRRLQSTLTGWHLASERRARRARDKIASDTRKVTERVLFAEPDEALRVVQAYERGK